MDNNNPHQSQEPAAFSSTGFWLEYFNSISPTLTAALLGAGIFAVTVYYRCNNSMAKKSLIKVSTSTDINCQSDGVKNDDVAKKSRLFETSSDDDCMRFLFEDVKTLYDVFSRGVRVSITGDCMGRLNGDKSAYEWISYEETIKRINNFGSGLLKLGLKQGLNTKIGIYATNCTEYIISEFGSYNNSMIVVPLYDTLGPNAVTFIVNQAEIGAVIVDSEERFSALLTQCTALKSLKIIIVLQPIIESYRSKARGLGLQVYTIQEVEEMGQKDPHSHLKPRPRDLAVICYTSGTTGNPKGAMLTHENIIANLSSVVFQLGDHAPNPTDTYMSFLPMAHMFERCSVAASFMLGARVGFFSGDIRKLSEEMMILKPTFLPCVPRLFNRIYDKVYASIAGSKLKAWLLRKALESKEQDIKNGIYRHDTVWDKLVFKKVRDGMGGQLRLVVVGSAPLAANVLNFMRCALGCVICEGYGQTECVCPCTLTLPGDYECGHVGPPLASAYVKLADAPDMEYYARENSGEVCVKGPIVFQGYFNDDGKTTEAIDNEGWLHTGDIGTWLPNGTLKIIDRKKHIFKLSQGEYISPEKIESIYSRSTFVAQIFIYGESIKSSLVGIVVPEADVLTLWARDHHIRGTLRDLCDDVRIKQAVMEDIHGLGKKNGLKSFEQVKDIYLYPEAFTIDNGLLTPTLKTKRPECRKFFVSQIEDMYRSLD